MAHELRAIGLGGNGANIKILDIGGSVDNDAIMNIAKGCPLLQEWNLSHRCKEIHFSGWKSIGLYCPNLKTIHVNEMFNFFDDKMMALSHCRRLSVIYMCLGWCDLRRSPREICHMMRKDMKIIEYKEFEVCKNTISWDDWDLQYDSKMRD
ncbi:RNI-like superfamily protein [Tanacetum coccineum]